MDRQVVHTIFVFCFEDFVEHFCSSKCYQIFISSFIERKAGAGGYPELGLIGPIVGGASTSVREMKLFPGGYWIDFLNF